MTTPQFASRKLYKFMKREHADLLVGQGNIRIATLFSFQQTEKYGNQIGDDQEGINTTRILGDGAGNAHITEMRLGDILFKDLTINGTPQKVPVRYVQRSEPYYILSFSLDNERTAMEKMGYDTCVEISDSAAFLRAASRALLAQGKVSLSGPYNVQCAMDSCVYMDKDVTISSNPGKPVVLTQTGVPIALQKRLEHEYQKEFRMVWVANTVEPEPVIVVYPDLKRLCKIIEPR